MDQVVFLNNVDDFVKEVAPPAVVRLQLYQTMEEGGPLPIVSAKLLTQGVNDLGEVVCLYQQFVLQRSPGNEGWFTARDKSIYDNLFKARDLLREYLTICGYEVRSGQIGIPKNLEKVAGNINCLEWVKAEDDSFTVKIKR